MNEAMQQWEAIWQKFFKFNEIVLNKLAKDEFTHLPKPKMGVRVDNAASEEQFHLRLKQACEEKGVPFFHLDCRAVHSYREAYNFIEELQTFGKPAVVYIANFTELHEMENRQPTFHLLVNSWKNDLICPGDLQLNTNPLFVFLTMRKDAPNPFNLLDRGWLGWEPVIHNAEGKVEQTSFPAL